MAQLAKGIVGGQMAWGLLAIGGTLGLALILFGARAPMLIAVGMYLPFDTTSAIFLGGVLRWVLDRLSARYSDEDKADIGESGTLLASGLIAGEAITGIVLAVAFVAGMPSLTHLLTGSDSFGFHAEWGGVLSLLGFASLAYLVIRIPLKFRSSP
jgi:uncharacterized oligopeptide transporter (OPT) family protein